MLLIRVLFIIRQQRCLVLLPVNQQKNYTHQTKNFQGSEGRTYKEMGCQPHSKGTAASSEYASM